MLLLAGPVVAQQPAPVFQVIEQTTVPLADGGSVTFKRVEPPVVVPPAPLPPVPVLTPAQLARQQEIEGKTSLLLFVSASVNAHGLTVLSWSCNGGPQFHAVSNVNFHHLEGLGYLETAESWYSIVMGIGSTMDALSPEAVQAVQALPTNGTAGFVLFQGQQPTESAAEPALQAMADLLAYYAVHRAELIAQHARRQTEAHARELAARNAPPPAPRNSVVHFWPLQPAQRAAIEANSQNEGQGPATRRHESMRPLLFSLLLLMVSAARPVRAQTADDLGEGLRVAAGTQPGDFMLTWWGRPGRTYFIQQSFDLMTWQYVPSIESGEEAVCGMNFSCTDPRQFWRLVYTDAPTGGNALTADFDFDGISNADEVSIAYGTNPFLPDTDWDGFTDMAEILAGSDPKAGDSVPAGGGTTTSNGPLNPDSTYRRGLRLAFSRKSMRVQYEGYKGAYTSHDSWG